MNKISTICIGEKDTYPIDLFKEFEQQGFSVVGKIHSFAEGVAELAKQTGPVVAIVELGADVETAFQLVEKIHTDSTNVQIVVTSSDQSAATVLRALRSGAAEFLPQPFESKEVREALERVRQKIEVQPEQDNSKGCILTVFSNKGGVGATTVATNLAVALASEKTSKKSVCLVDLDLQFGSISSVLNLDVAYTIVDMTKNLDRMDPMFLEGSLGKHASGVRILAAPNYTEEADSINATDVDRILDFLSGQFDFVILDCAKRLDETTLCALQKARHIVFVTQLDVPSMNLTRKALDLFERIHVPLDKIRLVLNQYVKNKSITLDAVEKTLNVKPTWILPWDREVTISALNQGLSVMETQPNSRLARAFRQFAQEINEAVTGTGQDSPKRRGLLGRWLPSVA